MVSNYPVTFDVDYPARPLNRVTTAFRIVLAIPILILIGTISGGEIHSGTTTSNDHQMMMTYVASGGGLLFIPPLLMILFRRKYPRWWFDWNLNLLRFSNRVTVYIALLDDQYPSSDEDQSVHLDFPYPDAMQLNRWLPLVKWFLAIPHYIVLFFLGIAVLVVVIIAWFAILFTGTYPKGLFDFVVGVLRWSNRVTGYASILVTDQYPPFSLR